MKNKFNSKKFLLTVALVLSLMVSSNNVVPAAENTPDPAAEITENSDMEMETPIVTEDTSDSIDDAITSESDTESDDSTDSFAEDFSEIDISGVTPDDIIFEDDITYINPCYEDTMSVDELVQAPEEEAPDLSSANSVFSAEDINGTTYYTTQEEAAAVIRSEMTERASSISFGYVYNGTDISGEMKSLFTLALTHTGVCNEGDYLKWVYGGWTGAIKGYNSNGTHYLIYTYTMTYYTTADQEAVLTSEVDNVFNTLGISDMATDYDKIEAIYQYICSHVTYDYTNLNDSTYKLKYTAYAALINGTSVCQGYATLFYYMSLKAGIDARFISGNANGGRHGWNIVQLDGLYYDMDSTWDSTFGSNIENYRFFLKCNADFPNHTRDADYSTDSFNETYPMADTSYQKQTQPEETEKTVSVYGHSLVLDGKIGVIFYLDISDAAKNVAGSYVSLKDSVSGAEKDIFVDDAEEVDGHYRFTYPVTAKQMADPITLTFYDGTTKEELCTDAYSVSDYAEEQMEAGDSISDLVAFMLDYGTCAQNYFDYQTDSPANAVLSTDGSGRTISDVDADTLKDYARVKSGTMPDGLRTYGQSLVLNTGVSVKFYYQLDDGAKISDYTATLVSGTTNTSLEWHESGDANCYYVTVDDINAADLDTMYEVDVTDGTSTGSVQYSAMTYVYNTLSADEDCSDSLKNLCCSLYYYNQAADQYFEG